MKNSLKFKDPEIAKLLEQEKIRQNTEINLIASENYVEDAVLEAMGSVLTNKYAEGYPGKRYYGGCRYVDQIEQLAIDRCKKLFNAENMHVNVQPHSGSSANFAVYNAILKPGDTILSMSLDAGGHLTHGHKVNFSGQNYNIINYGVNRETGLLDYEEIENLAILNKPKLIIAGASAYSRIIDFEKISEIAKKINAYFMADIAHIAGLIATSLHASPINCADFITSTTHKTLRGPRGGLIICKPEFKEAIDKSIMPGIQGGPLMNMIAAKAVAFELALKPDFKLYQEQVIKNAKVFADKLIELGYEIVSNGTDNHMFIVNLVNKNITGKEAENLLEKNGIIVSRSLVPFDTQKPWTTSGIRIGTPAVTTHGFKEEDIIKLAIKIDQILKLANKS